MMKFHFDLSYILMIYYNISDYELYIGFELELHIIYR